MVGAEQHVQRLRNEQTGTIQNESLTQLVKALHKQDLLWLTVFSVGVVGVFGFSVISFGAIGFIYPVVAAVPLTVLIVFSHLVAPRQRVPIGLRVSALIWGGAGSTTLTFQLVDLWNNLAGGVVSQEISVIVQAPLVEEFSKSLIFWGVLLFFRRLVNTPLNGAVVGLLAGAGFAFVENVLYFGRAYQSGGAEALWQTVILRSTQGFFVHSLATVFVGLLVGFLCSRKFSWKQRTALTFAGVVLPMTIHGLWNGMSSLSTVASSWQWFFFCFWLPVLFVVMIALQQIGSRFMTPAETAGVVGLRQDGMKAEYGFIITDPEFRKRFRKEHGRRTVRAIQRRVWVALGLKSEYEHRGGAKRLSKYDAAVSSLIA